MSVETREILDRLMELPAIEKAQLVDQLLSSLDEPDEAIDALWRKEVEDRIQAYRRESCNPFHWRMCWQNIASNGPPRLAASRIPTKPRLTPLCVTEVMMSVPPRGRDCVKTQGATNNAESVR